MIAKEEKSSLKDYLRAVYYNKFTLSGYISSTIGALTFYDSLKSPPELEYLLSSLLLWYGSTALLSTAFGFCTYNVYKQSKRHIKKHNIITEKFLKKCHNNYCSRAGVRMAIKEHRLEGLI